MKFLGTGDVARRLGVSAEYVRELERRGKLPVEKLESGQRIFRLEDVEHLRQERETKRAAEAAIRES